MGLGGDLGTRRHGVGIKVYINNLLGWGLGTWVYGGLGDKETGCRYQSVDKQPFRLGLGDLGLGGDLGTRRHGVGIKVHISNRLGWDLGSWGLGDKETGSRHQSAHKQPFMLGLGDLGLGPFRVGLGDLGFGGTSSCSKLLFTLALPRRVTERGCTGTSETNRRAQAFKNQANMKHAATWEKNSF